MYYSSNFMNTQYCSALQVWERVQCVGLCVFILQTLTNLCTKRRNSSHQTAFLVSFLTLDTLYLVQVKTYHQTKENFSYIIQDFFFVLACLK